MDFKLSPGQERFRAELRQWLEANGPGDWGRIRSKLATREAQAEFLIEWQRKLHAAGYVGLHWPTTYGGRGATVLEQAIFYEEMARARAPELPNAIGLDMAGPALIAHATEKQKQAHLPKILSAEHIFCQGFSEPNAGSDLANLQTRAVLDGDWYVLNGQKVWTSMAHVADWGFFLVRTDPSAAKHKGITFILVDMRTPGITIRPLRQITGEAEFNEVFLENVRVPAVNVVGKVNEGWGVAITTLAHERDVLTMIRHISLRTALERLVALAKRTVKDGRPASQDRVLRQKIANLQVAERCLQLNGYRSLTRILQGAPPGPEGSTSKLFWSQVDQDLADLATDIIGPYSQIAAPSALAPDDGQWEFYVLLARGSGIRAGTSEILRNILGERVLGLPKD